MADLVLVRDALRFSYLSQAVRHDKAYSAFGPAGSGWTKNRVEGVVPIVTGRLRGVHADGDEAILSVEASGGDIELAADHVIAATGYRADARLLPFLDPLHLAPMRQAPMRQAPMRQAPMRQASTPSTARRCSTARSRPRCVASISPAT